MFTDIYFSDHSGNKAPSKMIAGVSFDQHIMNVLINSYGLI